MNTTIKMWSFGMCIGDFVKKKNNEVNIFTRQSGSSLNLLVRWLGFQDSLCDVPL